MPAVPPGPLDRTERAQVAAYLAERLAGSVGLDVWTRDEGSALVRTDRDVCTHCPDVLALMRQLATLHPALTITPYDLTRHADRAQQAGIALAPTTVVRGRGRALQLVGLFSGLLFPLMLDLIAYVSNGWSPVQDETREGLQALTGPVEVEAMVSPYDAYSAHLARVVGAFAVESRAIRARIIEMAEFPVLAGQRSLVEVPALTINGRRFTGAWDEAELLEQLRRVLAGDAQLVVRNRVLVTRYVTEEEAHELARQHVTAEAEARGLAPEPWAPAAGTPPPDTPPPRPPERGGGGLYIPGRD